jgi:hypothetical protein
MAVIAPPLPSDRLHPAPAAPRRATAADVRDTLTLVVDADAAAVRAELARVQPLAGLVRGATALGVGDRLGLTDAPVDEPVPGRLQIGCAWRVDALRTVDVTASIAVASPLEGTSYLTVRTRFSGSDGVSRDDLVAAYAVLGPLWATSMRRLVAEVEHALAERDEIAA